MDDNPLQESLILLIEASIKHQRGMRERFAINRISDHAEIKLFLPRQIGLSTCIVKACQKFFDKVHILDTTHNYNKPNTHKSVNDIPMGVSCIIVDPWSVKYSGNMDWAEIKEKLWSKLDKSKPFLLVLAG
jgi:hypothetical protein